MSQNKLKDLAYINEFQTPVDVGRYMANLLPPGIEKILEPTPGVGNLVRILEERFYDVTAPADYWRLDKSLRFDAIVANLPFSTEMQKNLCSS